MFLSLLYVPSGDILTYELQDFRRIRLESFPHLSSLTWHTAVNAQLQVHLSYQKYSVFGLGEGAACLECAGGSAHDAHSQYYLRYSHIAAI